MPDLRCIITIESTKKVTIQWEPSLPDGPHEVSWVELLAAGAVMGMMNAKTGKGREANLRILKEFAEAKEKGA